MAQCVYDKDKEIKQMQKTTEVVPEQKIDKVYDNMEIKSSAFQNNGRIPAKHTCQGEDVNPQLEFFNIPEGTKSLALIVDDPDAPSGVWVHWLLWNIKPEIKEIKEGEIPEGAKQGLNDFGKREYNGPCPPFGKHRYFFKLYALDTALSISENSKKQELERAIQGHIIKKAELVGLYSKE